MQPLLLTISRDQASTRIDDRIRKGEEILSREIRNEEVLESARRDFYTWDEYNRELLRRIFTTSEIADEYSASGGFIVGEDYSFYDEVRDFKEDIGKDIRRLSSIKERLELIPLTPTIVSSSKENSSASSNSKAVFIVHGHDEALLQSVARFITQLELEPIILHEQPSKGRTVVEKLEAHSNVNFAVVLLTPDDVGGVDEKHLSRRARQNVVLELGFFLARLGRENVAALYKGELELPSDYMGVIYIPVDTAGAWKFSLAKEIKASGISIDLNKVL